MAWTSLFLAVLVYLLALLGHTEANNVGLSQGEGLNSRLTPPVGNLFFLTSDGVLTEQHFYVEEGSQGQEESRPASLDSLNVLANDFVEAAPVSCYDESPTQSSSNHQTSSNKQNVRFTRLPAESIGISHKYREELPSRPRCAFPIVIPSFSGNETINIHIDGEFCMPEMLSAAVVAGDYNNDGFVDLFFTVADGWSRLYQNQGDGTFRDVTHIARVGPPMFGSGAVWVDVDTDGDLDLFVTTVGDSRYYLYINDQGFFKEEAEKRGLAFQQVDRKLSGMTPNVGDYDRDGYPDIFVGEWMVHSVAKKTVTRLMRNMGARKAGFFEDQTAEAGLGKLDEYGKTSAEPGTYVFCSSLADMDNDGWPDLIMTADYGTSKIFWSNGNGTFTECTKQCGVTVRADAMGHAIGDWNMDGQLDWWMTAIHHDNSSIDCTFLHCKFSDIGNVFHTGCGKRCLTERTDQVGVRKGDWGWGNSMMDFNNDRWLDFVMTNGFDTAATTVDDIFSHRPMRAWQNRGPKFFGTTVEVAEEIGLNSHQSGRGLIKVDIDNDGDEDIVVANNPGRPDIFRNDGGNKNNWIKIRAQHRCTRTRLAQKICDSLNARVSVTSSNGWTQTQEVGSGSQFMGQNELKCHFGLGNNTNFMNVTVTWPRLNVTFYFVHVPANIELQALAPERRRSHRSVIVIAFRRIQHCSHYRLTNITQLNPPLGKVSINPDGRTVKLHLNMNTVRKYMSTLPTGQLPQIVFNYSSTLAPMNKKNAKSPEKSARVRIIYISGNAGDSTANSCHGDQVQPSDLPAVTDSRPLEGFSNNKNHVFWGAINRNLVRDLPVAYSDGISEPAGQCPFASQRKKNRPYCPFVNENGGRGSTRPSPRNISNVLFHQTEDVYSKRGINDMHAHFGQFLAHDLDQSSPLPRFEPMTKGQDVWFPISVPKGDVYFDLNGEGNKYLPFVRTNFNSCSGRKVIPQSPRQQFNKLTSALDGSLIYGSGSSRGKRLRAFKNGNMLVHETRHGDVLPFNDMGLANDNPVGRPQSRLMVAGDTRCNVQPGQIVLHAIFLREHNRLCDEYLDQNPGADDEEVFQAARKMIIAELQAITFREYLPALFGEEMPAYRGYNNSVNMDMGNSFTTAAFRFGHSQVGRLLWRLDENDKVIPEGHLLLRESYFAPERVLAEGGLEPLIRGMLQQPAQEIDTLMVSEMRNALFPRSHRTVHGSHDLASLNIQRGRDHGLPDYNTAREALGLPRVHRFEEITSDSSVVEKLKSLYVDVDTIDLWVGGLAEDKVAGGEVGLTFKKILMKNFLRLRDGDRFWYEHTMTNEEQRKVNRLTLAKILQMNSYVGALPDNSFFTPSKCISVKNHQCVQTPPTSLEVTRPSPRPVILSHVEPPFDQCKMPELTKQMMQTAITSNSWALLGEVKQILVNKAIEQSILVLADSVLKVDNPLTKSSLYRVLPKKIRMRILRHPRCDVCSCRRLQVGKSYFMCGKFSFRNNAWLLDEHSVCPIDKENFTTLRRWGAEIFNSSGSGFLPH